MREAYRVLLVGTKLTRVLADDHPSRSLDQEIEMAQRSLVGKQKLYHSVGQVSHIFCFLLCVRPTQRTQRDCHVIISSSIFMFRVDVFTRWNKQRTVHAELRVALYALAGMMVAGKSPLRRRPIILFPRPKVENEKC